MKSPKMPAAPDAKSMIKAQTDSNLDTAIANTRMGNANETNPFGSVSYKQIGTQMVGGRAVPQYERTVSLNEGQQKLYDQGVSLDQQRNDVAGQLLTNAGGALSKPMTLDGLTEIPTDVSAHRQGVEAALMSRLRPDMDRRRAALETKLANQGVQPGSEAWREAIALDDRSQNDAGMQALLQSGQEADRLITQASGLRAQGLQERIATRNQPLAELAALMSGTDAKVPEFAGYRGGQVVGTDVAGIQNQAYQNALEAAKQKAAGRNGMFGGIASTLGALAMAPMTGGGSVAGNFFGGLGR